MLYTVFKPAGKSSINLEVCFFFSLCPRYDRDQVASAVTRVGTETQDKNQEAPTMGK